MTNGRSSRTYRGVSAKRFSLFGFYFPGIPVAVGGGSCLNRLGDS